MKPFTLVALLLILAGASACTAPVETTAVGSYAATATTIAPLFSGKISGILDIPRTGIEGDVSIEFDTLGVYTMREPVAGGGSYMSERGEFWVDSAHSTLTLAPNGGAPHRTYAVVFSIDSVDAGRARVSLVLRSENGSFPLTTYISTADASKLPQSNAPELSALEQRIVGKLRGTLDIPRTAQEGDVDLILEANGLYQLREPVMGGGSYLSDRGAWSATHDTTDDRRTLTLVGNMNSGTRTYELRLEKKNDKDVAVLRSAAGIFVLSLP